MPESEYAPIILETIGEGSASMRTIKKACKVTNISNIRKALYTLLKTRKIEINGYDEKYGVFGYDHIMLKKVDQNYKNPIYVKGLLEKPNENDNYFEIMKVFKNRIEQINHIYLSEEKLLEDSIDKMPLKEAITSNKITPDIVYRREKSEIEGKIEFKVITLANVLEDYPEAEIWYLKKKFFSELGVISYSKGTPPFFNYWSGVKLDLKGKVTKKDFVQLYYGNHFNLPINEWTTQDIFKHVVLNALKGKEELKEEKLWKVASDLTDDGPGLIKFISEISFYLDSASEEFYHKYQLNL